VIEKSKAAADSRWAKEKARKDAEVTKKTGCGRNADAYADGYADVMRTDMPPTSNFQLPTSNSLNTPLPPKGEPSKPSKRKPKTTQGEWIIPQGMNQAKILEALGHFEEMRKSKGKPIANRENLSRIFPSFDDEAHLLYAITFATANEYQGIKVDYRPPLQPGKPIKRESDLPKIDANWEPA
jgi:hypothetical protein